MILCSLICAPQKKTYIWCLPLWSGDFRKQFVKRNWHEQREMCLCAQSKTSARHDHSGGEREEERGRGGNKETFLSFLFSLKLAHFHLLSVIFSSFSNSCSCFPSAAAKHHQVMYEHGCLPKWNLTIPAAHPEAEPQTSSCTRTHNLFTTHLYSLQRL